MKPLGQHGFVAGHDELPIRFFLRQPLAHRQTVPGPLERNGLLEKALGSVRGPPLRFVTTQQRGGLRRQAYVSHDRDASSHDRLDALD